MEFNPLFVETQNLQDQVLHLETVEGVEPLSERALRVVAHAGNWAEQRAAWAAIPTPARSESAA
jgi:hypothetical protein